MDLNLYYGRGRIYQEDFLAQNTTKSRVTCEACHIPLIVEHTYNYRLQKIQKSEKGMYICTTYQGVRGNIDTKGL